VDGLDGEIRAGRHRMAVRIYYEDTDFSGVVYHASYLRFLERGRTNLLRLIGNSHRALYEAARSEGFAFVVRAMAIEFFRPARMDDTVTIATEAVEVKGASMLLLQRVLRGAEVLVEARVRVACVSGGRARPIPKPLRLAMQAAQPGADGG
jgi:acyl-CoA thioester hydrolase